VATGDRVTKLDALIDCRGIMDELSVKRATAEAIMRKLQKVHIEGVRKVYVRRVDVAKYIEEQTAA
jgi:hypothetical protein